jgi:Family of unknown function (DUF5675)
MKYRLSRRSLLLAVAGATIATNALGQPQRMNLKIIRQYSSDRCTSGYFAVDDKIIAYALELPWLGNAPFISSIPVGKYRAFVRYDHGDKWRIELLDVPDNREHIQLHVGNFTRDTKGCILLGLGLTEDLCGVTDSQQAFRNLRKAFYGSEDPIMSPNIEITVTIVG